MQEDLDRRARRNVGARMGFLIHATVYGLVNAGLIAVAMFRTGNVHWPLFPALGWGIGLAAHGLAVFFSTSGVRDRMIERERRRLADRDAR
jgi:hypothetical protein